jgi:hypothetical protein
MNLTGKIRRSAMKTRLFTFFLTLTLAAVLALDMATMASAQGVALGDGVVITADVGIDLGTPVVEAIGSEARSRFTGRIPKVMVQVK